MDRDITRKIDSDMTSLYVQYGCGWRAPEGWVNFDASPTLLFERVPLIGRLYVKNHAPFPANVRYGDIARGLPIPSGSVVGLYASHVLEHLAFEDCHKAFANSYALLKQGGIFRLIVPDLRARAEEYLCSNSADAAHVFMRSTCLGRESRPRGLMGRLTALFGNSPHLWMWDEASMTAALQEEGFRAIRRCEFGDSEDPMFRLVEDQARFRENGFRELAIEARK